MIGHKNEKQNDSPLDLRGIHNGYAHLKYSLRNYANMYDIGNNPVQSSSTYTLISNTQKN